MALPDVIYRMATATNDDVFRHLSACSENFTPRLSERVNLEQYSRKLADFALTFEAWHEDTLVCLVAAYFNDMTNLRGYITSVSTVESYMGRGIAKALIRRCIEHGLQQGFHEIWLEIHRESTAAIGLYRSCGFVEAGSDGDHWSMKLVLVAGRPNG